MKKIMLDSADYFGVGVDELRLSGGNGGYARFVAAYLGVQDGCPLDEIAASLGMSPVAVHLAEKAISRKLASGEHPELEQAVASIRTAASPSRWRPRTPYAPPRRGATPYAVPAGGHYQPRGSAPAWASRSAVGDGDAFFRTHRFVIDALNICYLGSDHRKANHPCLANMVALTRDLDRRGAEWLAFWDPFNPNRFVQPGEARRFEQMMRADPQRHIQVEGMKADLAVLMAASKPSPSGLPALMVTDDRYRDHAATNQFPIALDPNRFLRATKVGDELWFPSANCWSVKIG